MLIPVALFCLQNCLNSWCPWFTKGARTTALRFLLIWCESCTFSHLKRCFLSLISGDWRPICVQWTHYYVQKASLKWYELCDTSSWNQKASTLYTDVQQKCTGRLHSLGDAKGSKTGLENIPIHYNATTIKLNCWYKVGFWSYHMTAAAELKIQ